MREIKFRAWHRKRKKFYEVLHLHIYTIMDKGPWATCRGRNCIEQQDVHIQVQPEDCLIEQFTGLLDKNGKEIYEGDVVNSYCTSKNLSHSFYKLGALMVQAPVVYRPNLCAFTMSKGLEFKITDELDLEVIGNIHENPELLEGLA